MVTQFITRKQYDWLLNMAFGWMKCAYPMLQKKWCDDGVTVYTNKKQLFQHISRLRTFLEHPECPQN